MAISKVEAVATTCDVAPGQEKQDASGVHIRNRTFTDRVESETGTFDGTNRVTVDLDVNPADGTGKLAGTFELALSSGAGGWKGEVSGHLEGGMVVAEGLARGTGSLEGAVLHIDYRQIKEHPKKAPCEKPLAFFRMKGLVLPAR